MPALATTTSSRPNAAMPSATATRSASASRTSPCAHSIRLPSCSTRNLVSSRSSAVAIGKGTLSICTQMSTPMTSAPSSASRIAWLRPCPRAAPVMSATLPATRVPTDNSSSDRWRSAHRAFLFEEHLAQPEPLDLGRRHRPLADEPHVAGYLEACDLAAAEVDEFGRLDRIPFAQLNVRARHLDEAIVGNADDLH